MLFQSWANMKQTTIKKNMNMGLPILRREPTNDCWKETNLSCLKKYEDQNYADDHYSNLNLCSR